MRRLPRRALESRAHALDFGLRCAEVPIARPCGLFARAERLLLLTQRLLAGGEPPLIVDALALDLALALGDRGELLRNLGRGVCTVMVCRLELLAARVDVDAELGEPRLLGDQLGAAKVEVTPLGRANRSCCSPSARLALVELRLARREARADLLGLGLAEREVVVGGELALVRLELMLKRVAKLLLARQRILELGAERRELWHDRLDDDGHLLELLGSVPGAAAAVSRAVAPLLALELRAQAGAEPVFDRGSFEGSGRG